MMLTAKVLWRRPLESKFNRLSDVFASDLQRCLSKEDQLYGHSAVLNKVFPIRSVMELTHEY